MESPRTGVTGACELPNMVLGTKLESMEEQKVLLTTEDLSTPIRALPYFLTFETSSHSVVLDGLELTM